MAEPELDPVLTRAFAEQSPTIDGDDAAFLARVNVGVAAVERRRRWLRGALALVFALIVLAVTPLVVQLSLSLVVAALSPAGAVTAVCLSLGAMVLVLRFTLS